VGVEHDTVDFCIAPSEPGFRRIGLIRVIGVGPGFMRPSTLDTMWLIK
jgi:hypothetical protein